ncbi:MAG: hypothetical protein KatS3mg111_2961 [Pirellulaceae bacterium]|nr:MAG: hypothetical protein KatS3mg111_2961 [Pirellulaceae bacterium]
MGARDSNAFAASIGRPFRAIRDRVDLRPPGRRPRASGARLTALPRASLVWPLRGVAARLTVPPGLRPNSHSPGPAWRAIPTSARTTRTTDEPSRRDSSPNPRFADQRILTSCRINTCVNPMDGWHQIAIDFQPQIALFGQRSGRVTGGPPGAWWCRRPWGRDCRRSCWRWRIGRCRWCRRTNSCR